MSLAFDPPVSEAQRRAMWSAAELQVCLSAQRVHLRLRTVERDRHGTIPVSKAMYANALSRSAGESS